jgi:putative glutamine amidotransferase
MRAELELPVSKPLIGVITYRNQNQLGFTQFSASEAYTSSLVNAGGIPLLIPLGQPQANLEALLSSLDGILFTGGGDIAPERYGGAPNPLVSDIDPDRDRLEIDLVPQIIKIGKPFLGICRGLQVINVSLGGSLYEDITAQRPGSLKHQYFPGYPREHLAHPVQIETDSRLADILRDSQVQVNSLHHQGVKQLAQDLRPTAFAPDGIIEAFELPSYPYGLAVQWHPENLQAHQTMRDLFRSFVLAAQAEKASAQRL